MSKKRPSSSLLKTHPAYWRERVFQNTFTRSGRRFTVDKWCVKIQHGGRRRTFSLKAVGRADAAAEAHRLYLKLVKDGWEGLNEGAGESGNDRGASKLSVGYWQEALVVRPGSSKRHWSAWLDHEGAGYYFPLRRVAAAWAAKEALKIYQKVRTLGWAEVFNLYPREVTVAFHWADNPLAWTYTTFTTLLGPVKAAERSGQMWRVVVVTADQGLRQAMKFYINQHPGFACAAAFNCVEVAQNWMCREDADLLLVDQNLPEGGGVSCLSQLKRVSERTLGMLFSVYADSGQLFECSPGGATGYLFKRTAPERMLEPLLSGPMPERLPAEYLATATVSYFQQVLGQLEMKTGSSRLASLTPRESQILDYLSKGSPDKEIASAMGISAWTVHGHLKSIFEKLQVHNRLEAVLKYLNK